METVKANPVLEPSEVKDIENANEPENNPNPEIDPGDEPEDESENDPSDEPEYDPIDESESDSRDESESDPMDESKYLPSLNAVTCNEMKEILYELHEYFDEFKIEVVSRPSVSEEPDILEHYDLCGKMKIEEIYNPRYLAYITEILTETGDRERSVMRAGRNYFFGEKKTGMLLKIQAIGRKTNYNIITLIQRILYERFWFKIGLGGLFEIEGGFIIKGTFMHHDDQLTCQVVDCLIEEQIPVGAIVNDPVKILDHYAGLFYTRDRYLFRFISQFKGFDRFVNDFILEETEYIGYFNVAEKVTHI